MKYNKFIYKKGEIKMERKRVLAMVTALMLLLTCMPAMNLSAAVANQYNPTMTETFDSQSNSIGMNTPWLTQSYVLKEGTDYWWNVAFPKNNDGLYGETGNVITSSENEYYIEFDFSTDVCDNFSIVPATSGNVATHVSLSMSRHGYMIGTSLTAGIKGLANDQSVLENSRATAEANKNGWMKCSDTQDYVAGQTYTGRYVFNKTNNTIDLYMNNVLLRSATVTNVSDYTKLIIFAHYSNSNNATKNLRLDNVEVGTVSKITVPGPTVNVSSANITTNGVLSLVFDADVDGATLNSETVKVFADGEAKAYTDSSYNNETKTWTATVLNYDAFNNLTVKVDGAKGTDDNSVAVFEKTFAGVDYIYNPVLDENFDDSAINNTAWGNEYLTETFDDASGRGKVWTIPFGPNMANNAVNGELGGLSQYMTGDVNYIKFDFKTENLYNFTFTPLTASDYTAYLNFSTSRHGWMYANKFATVNQNGLNDDINVLDSSAKATISNASWRQGGEVVDYAAGKWYTVTYVFDKTNETIKLYLNDTLQYEVKASATVLNSIDRLFIWNHKSSVDGTTSRFMSLDNLEVGTLINPLTVKNVSFENGTMEIEFSEAVKEASLNSNTVLVTSENGVETHTGSYDATTNVYTCVIDKYNPYKDYMVTVKNVTNEDGKNVKRFEKTFTGIDYIYTSSLNDTYDNGSANLSWRPNWCPEVEYIDEMGKGKVAAIKYANKAAITEVNIALPISQYLTQSGDVKYISFDLKTSELRNLAFTLTDDAVSYYPVSFLLSEKNWALGRTVEPSYNAESELVKNYFANSKATLEGWGVKTFGDYAAREWNNVKFILDSINGKIDVLLNDNVIYSYNDTAANQAKITKLLVINCSAETDNTKNIMYIDNFQIGTARTEKSDVVIVDYAENRVLDGQNVDTVYSSAIIKNTLGKKISAMVSCASYDESGKMIDVKVKMVDVEAGETVIVNASDCEGLDTNGATTVKAFVWSDWSSITPLAPFDEAILAD